MRSIKEIKNAVPLDQKLTFFAQKLILRSASPQPAPASPSSQYQPVPAPTQFSKMWFQKENLSKVWVKTFGQNFRSKRFGQNVSVKTFGQNVSVKTFGQNFRSKLIGTQTLNNFYKRNCGAIDLQNIQHRAFNIFLSLTES